MGCKENARITLANVNLGTLCSENQPDY